MKTDNFNVALGKALHESGLDAREPGVMQAAVEKALAEGGFGQDFLKEAISDPTTLETVLAEHDEAVEKYKAYGVPWLIVDDTGFGFNGPVITEVPQGKAALELWEHFAWLIQQPYFYEVKRNR
jgi:2-hydroxychromene-2-carboxylate isomerase